MSRGPALIGDPGEPVEVPFRGLRRNARALAGGLILLLAIAFLLPDLSPPPTQPPAVELLRGEIVEFLPSGPDGTGPDVRLLVTAGPRAGRDARRLPPGPVRRGGPAALRDRRRGRRQRLAGARRRRSSRSATCTGSRRWPLLLAIFAVAVTVVGGWRGVRSLIALALTLAVIVKIVVPLILAGWDPVLVAILAATGVTIATFLLTEGVPDADRWRPRSGRSRRWRWSPVLAVVFDELARFTQFRGSEDATYPPGGRAAEHRHRRAAPGRRSSSARWASSTT